MSELTPSDLAFAVADPTRLRLLVLLHTSRRELCVCELTTSLDLDQPKISRHLKALRERGVLSTRRDGQWIHYRLDPQLPLWAIDVLRGFADGTTGQTPYVDDAARLAHAGCAP